MEKNANASLNTSARTRTWTTVTMVKVSLLAVIAALLMFIQTPIPMALPFMKLDLADLPSLIAGFALGPVAGIVVVLLKNLLHLVIQGTTTAYVGELSNFFVNGVYVLASALIYRAHKTKKRALMGLVVGGLVMTIAATCSNYFVIFPLYSKLYGLPMDQIIAIGSKVNPWVADYRTMMLFAVVPFNLVKAIVTGFLAMLLYKPLSPILHKKSFR